MVFILLICFYILHQIFECKCDHLDIVKESVFRKFDINIDGTLSPEELKTAITAHDVDSSYLDYLKSSNGFGEKGASC